MGVGSDGAADGPVAQVVGAPMFKLMGAKGDLRVLSPAGFKPWVL
jgi:hypothetical protein